MPSKKPNKAAKRPGKATPKKATHKVAAPKKVVRPPAKAKPSLQTSKVTVKPNKPAPKPVIDKPMTVKPAAVKVPRPKPEVTKVSNEKVAPIKFDTRPLVVTRLPQNDEDNDGESATSASLLAGPRNVKPYIARRGEQYMNKEQLEHFARILQSWKRDLMVEVDRTVLHMKDEAANFPDPNDRATQEEEFSLELRTRASWMLGRMGGAGCCGSRTSIGRARWPVRRPVSCGPCRHSASNGTARSFARAIAPSSTLQRCKPCGTAI
jgi:DnaK suppressor protein